MRGYQFTLKFNLSLLQQLRLNYIFLSCCKELILGRAWNDPKGLLLVFGDQARSSNQHFRNLPTVGITGEP